MWLWWGIPYSLMSHVIDVYTNDKQFHTVFIIIIIDTTNVIIHASRKYTVRISCCLCFMPVTSNHPQPSSTYLELSYLEIAHFFLIPSCPLQASAHVSNSFATSWSCTNNTLVERLGSSQVSNCSLYHMVVPLILWIHGFLYIPYYSLHFIR